MRTVLPQLNPFAYIPVGSLPFTSHESAENFIQKISPDIYQIFELPKLGFTMEKALFELKDKLTTLRLDSTICKNKSLLKFQIPGFWTLQQIHTESLYLDDYTHSVEECLTIISRGWKKRILLVFDEPMIKSNFNTEYIEKIRKQTKAKNLEIGIHFCNTINQGCLDKSISCGAIDWIHLDWLLNRNLQLNWEYGIKWVLGVFPSLDWQSYNVKEVCDVLKNYPEPFYLSSTCGLANASVASLEKLISAHTELYSCLSKHFGTSSPLRVGQSKF